MYFWIFMHQNSKFTFGICQYVGVASLKSQFRFIFFAFQKKLFNTSDWNECFWAKRKGQWIVNGGVQLKSFNRMKLIIFWAKKNFVQLTCKILKNCAIEKTTSAVILCPVKIHVAIEINSVDPSKKKGIFNWKWKTWTFLMKNMNINKSSVHFTYSQ